MLQAYVSAWITVSVDHVAVLTKDRPLSVVPIIVDYYMGSVKRHVKKQGSHGQGLLITVLPHLIYLYTFVAHCATLAQAKHKSQLPCAGILFHLLSQYV